MIAKLKEYGFSDGNYERVILAWGWSANAKKQGLVKQLKDLERRNIIGVAITEKGEQAYQRSRDTKVIHEILSNLSQEQQDNLRPYLETLRNRAVEELRPRYRLPFP